MNDGIKFTLIVVTALVLSNAFDKVMEIKKIKIAKEEGSENG